MKAIQTRIYPATDFKGCRVTAWTKGGNRITIPYQYELTDSAANQLQAALDLCIKLEWQGDLQGGTLPNGDMCFVFADTDLKVLVIC